MKKEFSCFQRTCFASDKPVVPYEMPIDSWKVVAIIRLAFLLARCDGVESRRASRRTNRQRKKQLDGKVEEYQRVLEEMVLNETTLLTL